jgi:hypothetical protein
VDQIVLQPTRLRASYCSKGSQSQTLLCSSFLKQAVALRKVAPMKMEGFT